MAGMMSLNHLRQYKKLISYWIQSKAPCWICIMLNSLAIFQVPINEARFIKNDPNAV